MIARRMVEDDNSCLFSAVAYVMEGYRSKGPELRYAPPPAAHRQATSLPTVTRGCNVVTA